LDASRNGVIIAADSLRYCGDAVSMIGRSAMGGFFVPTWHKFCRQSRRGLVRWFGLGVKLFLTIVQFSRPRPSLVGAFCRRGFLRMPRQFTAQDAHGDEIVVFIEHAIFDTTTNQLGGKNRLPGMRTEDGRYVNYLRKGRYEIIDDDGNILRFRPTIQTHHSGRRTQLLEMGRFFLESHGPSFSDHGAFPTVLNRCMTHADNEGWGRFERWLA
jgi:hypothetical protein